MPISQKRLLNRRTHLKLIFIDYGIQYFQGLCPTNSNLQTEKYSIAITPEHHFEQRKITSTLSHSITYQITLRHFRIECNTMYALILIMMSERFIHTNTQKKSPKENWSTHSHTQSHMCGESVN